MTSPSATTESRQGSGQFVSPQRRRGRILAVGNSAAVRELEHVTDRPILQVSNLFDAVGELCIAGPHEPIDAVLIDGKCAQEATTRALQSLRRLDPSVLLVLVTDGDGSRLDTARREQFDYQLTRPLTRSRIEGLFTGQAAPADDEPDAEQVAEIEVDQRTIAASLQPNGGATTYSPPMTPRSDAPTASHPPQHEQNPPARGMAADSHSALRDSEPLGDIDLVHAVMHDPRGVRDRALQLIAQQTGWNDVTLHHEPTTRGVAIVHNNEFHGSLVADGASPQDLEQWADWLGYWLALDEAYRTNRTLALTDELTGAWNRRYFESFLSDCMARATKRRRPVTVMVFDLDDFKLYNDNFGHAAGDEILRETVRLLTSVIRQGDRVCRIGGDEFAVVFADLDDPRDSSTSERREKNHDHPQDVGQIAQRFQDEICKMRFPKLGIEAPGTLSISAGLATFPWDGRDAASLLEHADQLALESKRRGKNVITLGPGAQRNCGPSNQG